MSTILLLSAGRRVDLLQSFSRASRDLLPSGSRVFAADACNDLSAACSFADESFFLPRVNSPDYLTSLLSLCRSQDVRLIIPTIDTELPILSSQQSIFNKLGVDVLISDYSLVELCRDKRKTFDLFTSIGIKSPLIFDPSKISYPCFVKPISGSCSQGARIVNSESDLSISDLEDPDNIFQELVPSSWQEYSVDCLFGRDGRLISMVPRERLETRAGEISKGITRRGAVMQLLKPALTKLVGARGCLTVQVFLSPEQDSISGIEINPRFGGGYPLSHSAGARFPELIISEWLLGGSPPWHDNWRSDLLMLRYDSMVFRSLA